jgi:type III restriction enzyme
MLDVLSGQRVRILEKGDPLNARRRRQPFVRDAADAAVVEPGEQDSLKMFRDRGDVHGFFPPEGDQEAHALALARTPESGHLRSGGQRLSWSQVKDSLGNALRLIRPVVVMDEGHKAVSELAFATLYGFNPCFVLELTATPKDVQPLRGRTPSRRATPTCWCRCRASTWIGKA